MARAAVLVGTVAMLALLLALTVRVLLRDGVTVLVVMSIAILVVVGFGAVGALTGSDD